MNTTLSKSSAIAATRALAKARFGDRAALQFLIERREAGDIAAIRALEDYNKYVAAHKDASIISPN